MGKEHIKKIGLIGLTAMVMGSMIGGGIFNIPQNMAEESALGPVIIAWLITAAGMLALAFTFKYLSEEFPQLSDGIYAYAKEGFGNYIGFNSAWGYWIASATGNVAFAVMLNDALGHFFPVLLNHGWQTVVFGVLLIWFYNFVVLRGVKEATSINTITVIIKFITIAAIIVALVIYFNWDTFSFDFWGKGLNLGSIGKQIKTPMLVTLWCFIGIEGAVVISGRAKRPSEVGVATVIGFFVAFFLYLAISVLAYGIMKQPELSKLTDPSSGYLLQHVAGNWMVDFVNIAVIISVGGAWVAWTVLVAEVPYSAALDKNLPTIFERENKAEVPSAALYISSIIMTIFMILVVTAKNVYMAAIEITGVIVLPSYLLSSLFLWKTSVTKEIFKNDKRKRNIALFVGIVSTIYCIWLLYAAGLRYLLIASIVYAIGIYFFYIARREQKLKKGEDIFQKYEKWIAVVIGILAVISIILLIMGKIDF